MTGRDERPGEHPGEGSADPADDAVSSEGPDPVDDPDRDDHAAHTVHAEDVGAFIKAQRELARMSVRRLADVAGVSNPYLSQIERGIRRPSAEILQQLADALRISAESLYVRAGFLRADETRPADSVPAAIERDPHLTPEQKVALVQVYRSFVGEARSGSTDRS
jgi:transcriptional regulator with XRE-family HTH domain